MEKLKASCRWGMLATTQFKILFSFHLQSKTVNMTVDKTIILPLILYRYETWSLTSSEERRLRVLEEHI
jgi:hypothetical protein